MRGITITGTFSENEVRQMVTKLDKCSVVTINAINEWVQYLIMNYASKEDFEKYLKDMPTKSHSILHEAYNLNKMNTLNDLDFLGSPLGNVN